MVNKNMICALSTYCNHFIVRDNAFLTYHTYLFAGKYLLPAADT